MQPQFSRETQELLDRAQRAIDDSVDICRSSSRITRERRKRLRDFELALADWHALAGPGTQPADNRSPRHRF